MSKESVLYLLKKYHLRPDDHQGQNFLYDDRILADIVGAAGLKSSDKVLEIGAGIGNLTALLAQSSAIVVSVEKDKRFAPVLSALAGVNTNIDIVYGDILTVPFPVLKERMQIHSHGQYRVVANIPYYMTSRILAQCLKYPLLPDAIVVLVQKEVAERIIAKPGQHSKLSLSIQLYGVPEIALSVPRKYFIPEPDVDSALLAIRRIHPWQYSENEKRVWQLIAFGFSSKRKKLINNLMAGLQETKDKLLDVFEKAEIAPDARAQTLSADQWRALSGFLDTHE